MLRLGTKRSSAPTSTRSIPRKEAAGDILVTVNGEYVTVEKVQHEILENPVKVYNFEVAGFHTYFVSESNILVHNLCAKKYYKATRTDNSIIRGSKITKSQALNRIRKGKDVIANSRSAAKALAKDAFGNSKFIKEIHNLPNAMWHYHDKARHFYHVFF